MVFILDSGKQMLGETVLFTVGRVGQDTADYLNLFTGGWIGAGRAAAGSECSEKNQPDVGSPHLRRGRRRRLSGLGQRVDGTGTPEPSATPSVSRSNWMGEHLPYGLLRRPGDFDGGQDRSRA